MNAQSFVFLKTANVYKSTTLFYPITRWIHSKLCNTLYWMTQVSRQIFGKNYLRKSLQLSVYNAGPTKRWRQGILLFANKCKQKRKGCSPALYMFLKHSETWLLISKLLLLQSQIEAIILVAQKNNVFSNKKRTRITEAKKVQAKSEIERKF